MNKHEDSPPVTTFGSRPISSPNEPYGPPSKRFGSGPLSASQRSRSGGLGRGLDSLIPSTPAESDLAGLLRAPIGSISPNPSQPRQEFDQEQLEELAASIREHGILQPLLVRRSEAGQYELIAGERRWRAAGLARLDTVPIVVQKDANAAEERLTLALVENLQRADLNPIEMATAFEQLSDVGWTQEDIAKEVGKSRVSVANVVRLRRLPDVVQSMIVSRSLSEGHGRALLGAPESERITLAERTAKSGWTVRKLEEAVRALVEPPTAPPRDNEPSPSVLNAVQCLESALGTKVEVRIGAKGPERGGRIVVHWYDEEQLAALAALMSGEVADVAVDEEGSDTFEI